MKGYETLIFSLVLGLTMTVLEIQGHENEPSQNCNDWTTCTIDTRSNPCPPEKPVANKTENCRDAQGRQGHHTLCCQDAATSTSTTTTPSTTSTSTTPSTNRSNGLTSTNLTVLLVSICLLTRWV